MSVITPEIRELVNRKLHHKSVISHNDIEEVLIDFYRSQGIEDVSVEDDEFHEAITELWVEFDRQGRADL